MTVGDPGRGGGGGGGRPVPRGILQYVEKECFQSPENISRPGIEI